MTPPPGTPGAATIVIPSIKMNGRNMDNVGVSPLASIMPMEPITRQIVSPERWIVAHNGMTKSAISSETPLSLLLSRFTGIVDAEDCVPSAVKYAGAMPFKFLNLFSFVNSVDIKN